MAATERVRQSKAVLDEVIRLPDPDVEWTAEERSILDEAVATFLGRGPDLLDEATEPLWAYYRSVVEEAGDAVVVIPAGADIWEHVAFHREPPEMIVGGAPLLSGRSYVSFEGEVSWEPEHGLQLVVEHGQRVCKVGPYDGHMTNAHARADPALLDVVFVR